MGTRSTGWPSGDLLPEGEPVELRRLIGGPVVAIVPAEPDLSAIIGQLVHHWAQEAVKFIGRRSRQHHQHYLRRRGVSDPIDGGHTVLIGACAGHAELITLRYKPQPRKENIWRRPSSRPSLW
nr:MAG TPA: hypothetical protein [Caudoviricetes sp.]